MKIAVLNESSASDEEIGAWTNAIQIQMTRDVAKVYPVDAAMRALPKGSSPPVGEALIVYRDRSDQPNAAGYHLLLDVPVGYIFVLTDREAGLDPATTGSHETIELVNDPWICLGAQLPDGTWAAWEPCDMPEDVSYQIDGINVSDFVLPEYFDGTVAPAYDFCGKLTSPAPALLPGGYISLYKDGVWTSINADKLNRHPIRSGWSRRWRRMHRREGQ